MRLDFASPNVLGLAGDPRIAAAERRGTPPDAHVQLENEIGRLTGRPRTTIVPDDAAGLATALATTPPGATVLVEATAPADWMDAIRAAGASAVTYPRHDLTALDRLLDDDGRRVVVAATLSSFEGDVADVQGLPGGLQRPSRGARPRREARRVRARRTRRPSHRAALPP